MDKEIHDILMEKLNNIDIKVNDFSTFARANFKSINEDITELKATTKRVEKQATLTNSRVTKLEDTAINVKEFEDKMKFVLFFREHYKVLIPGIGAFTGAMVVAYTVISYLIEKLM